MQAGREQSHFDPDIGRRLERFSPRCCLSWRLLLAVPSGNLHIGQCTVAQGSMQSLCTVWSWEGWTDGHLKILHHSARCCQHQVVPAPPALVIASLSFVNLILGKFECITIQFGQWRARPLRTVWVFFNCILNHRIDLNFPFLPLTSLQTRTSAPRQSAAIVDNCEQPADTVL